MIRVSLRACLTLVTCFVLTQSLHAEMVTFESVPGYGNPTAGMAITNQYASSLGMSFSLAGGGAPIIAQVGGGGGVWSFDTAHGPASLGPGNSNGSYFITESSHTLGVAPAALDVTFNGPVNVTGGQILDIDTGSEAWTIQAYNSSNSLIDSLVIKAGDPGTGDGVATNWSFIHAMNDIAFIRILYTGLTDHIIGFGFDNFYWTDLSANPNIGHAPAPGALALLASGLVTVIVPGWRRFRKASFAA